MSRRCLALRIPGLIVGLLLGLMPIVAHAEEPVKVTVEITESGFNGQPDYTLEVDQGKVYEVTFVFAQKAALGDSHIIELKGYGLETPEINFYNKEATLKFVADKPGTFELLCALDCEIHDKLQKGHLKVRGAAGSGSAVSLSPTALTLFPSAWEVAGEPVKLSATLKESGGVPIPKAMVRFYVEAEFGGTKGQMEIGAARTDANGSAVVSYKPTFTGKQRITARFEGMGLFAESQQTIELQVKQAEPAYLVAPRGLEPVSDRLPYVAAFIIVGIWSTFVYVLFQVYRIRQLGIRA